MNYNRFLQLKRLVTIESLIVEIQDMMFAHGDEARELATKMVDSIPSSRMAVEHKRIIGNAIIILDMMGLLKEKAS